MQGLYNVITLDKWAGVLRAQPKNFRNLEKNEILIKVVCTTVHPADLMFLQGNYGDMKPDILPVIPGFEGCGEIIKVGEDVDPKYIGKRASIFADSNKIGIFDGLWSQYHYTTLSQVMVFDTPVPYERICFIINPLTAVGMLSTLIKNNVHSVIINAAASSLGKMLIQVCARENINLVNIVKDKDEYNQLKEIGAQNIIVMNEEEYENEVIKQCVLQQVTACFDCIGGEASGKLFSLLPPYSTMYHFGNLENKDLSKFQSHDFIYLHKKLKGWWLPEWMKSLSKNEIEYWWGYVNLEITTNSKLFHTEITKIFKLDEIQTAIDEYKSHMNKGKIILFPFNN